jgi:hypothetical protein
MEPLANVQLAKVKDRSSGKHNKSLDLMANPRDA